MGFSRQLINEPKEGERFFCKLVPKLRENFETFGLLKGAAAMAEMGWVFGLGNLLGYC